jgi:nucleoside-diphosphate-sugar epimerase
MDIVDGIIHVASDTSVPVDAAKVMHTAKRATLNVLEAAARTPSVSRVVITSSSAAATLPTANKKIHIDQTFYARTCIQQVSDASADETGEKAKSLHGYVTYSASKAEAELAALDFMKRTRPTFVLNTILPNFNMGKILPGVKVSATGQTVIDTYHGKPP